jgi:hypothetical protein
VFKTKTVALDHSRDVVEPRLRGTRSELTLAELVELHVKRHEAIRSPRTIRVLRERMRRPLDKYGSTTLADLETMALDLAGWRRTLPPRYAPKVIGALRQVLAAGVRWRLTTGNPAVDAGPNREADPAPVRVYTVAELDAIADELSDAYRPLPAFGAATGLRPEEWSALERRHVDRATAARQGRAGERRRRARPAAQDEKLAPRGSAHRPRSRRARHAPAAARHAAPVPGARGRAAQPRQLPQARLGGRPSRPPASRPRRPPTTCATRSPRARSPPASPRSSSRR